MTARHGRPSDDDAVTIGVRLTWEQFRDINRRARLGPLLTRRARSAYVVGCLFDEPRDALLERVRELADEERARFRAEIEAERAAKEPA